MAISLVTSPDACMCARNPIAYVINTDATGDVVEIELTLKVNDFNSVTQETLVTLRAEVDADGNATFYVERYVRDALGYELPDQAVDTAQALLNGAKEFEIDYDEIVDGVAGASGTGGGFVGALAGFAFWLWPTRAALLPNGFMGSIKPIERWMPTDKPDWVYVFNPAYATFGGAVLTLVYTVNYTDATDDSISESYPAGALDDDIQQYQIIAVPIGWSQKLYNTVNPAKTIANVVIELGTAGTITLYPLETEPWNMRAFYYFSRTTGGLESVFLKGEQAESIETDRTRSIRFVPYDYTAKTAQKKVNYSVPNHRFKVHTGMMDQDLFEAVKELLYAEEAFVYLDDSLVAVNILTDGKELPSDNNTLHGFEFEYEYAHQTQGRP